MTNKNEFPVFPICETKIIPIFATKITCPTGKVYCSKTGKALWEDGHIVEVFSYKKDPSYYHGVAALVRKQGTTELRWIGVGLLSADAWFLPPDLD